MSPVGFAQPDAHLFGRACTWLQVAAMSEGLGHLIWDLPGEENPAALVSESELTSHLRPTGQESGNFQPRFSRPEPQGVLVTEGQPTSSGLAHRCKV